jgi:hypothetical protein
MKTIVVLLISCFLLSFCSKRDNSNEEKQEVLSHEILDQKTKKPDISYVFDIESFRSLEEFPKTIEGIKTMYPNEPFEEEISENKLKGFVGAYWYLLKSSNIEFYFLGDSIDVAMLNIVIIFQPDYQCKTMQIIGMSAKELENVSGEKLTRDGAISIYTELYVLYIETQDGIVKD